MKVTQGTKSPHRKLAQTLNNKPNKQRSNRNTCSIEWDIKYKHITAFFFVYVCPRHQ